jgi:hypothetical protein
MVLRITFYLPSGSHRFLNFFLFRSRWKDIDGDGEKVRLTADRPIHGKRKERKDGSAITCQLRFQPSPTPLSQDRIQGWHLQIKKEKRQESEMPSGPETTFGIQSTFLFLSSLQVRPVIKRT